MWLDVTLRARPPSSPSPKSPEDLDSVIREVIANSTPVQHGPHFDDLVALIEEELGAQIAMERLGELDPPAEGVHTVALLVADMVDRAYALERRARR